VIDDYFLRLVQN